MVAADQKIDLFEWTLQRALLRHLSPHFERVSPPRVRYRSLRRIGPQCAVVLSTLWHVEAQAGADARGAYEQCAADLGLPGEPLAVQDCGLAALDDALHVLDEAAPALKRRILVACAQIVSADARVSVAEAELFRSIADSLSCPVPPLLPGQPLAPAAAGEEHLA